MKKIFFTLIVLLQTFLSYSQTKNIVTYPNKSTINWTDFKEINTSKDTLPQFNFSTSIQMKTLKVNFWTGVATFEANGIIYPENCWVAKQCKNEQLLSYCQVQYEISNSIGKHLSKDINSRKINIGYKNKIESVFKEYESRLNLILQKMDSETHYGSDLEMINKWKDKLNNDTL